MKDILGFKKYSYGWPGGYNKVKWHHDFAFEVKVSLGLESTSPDGVGHVSRTPRLAIIKPNQPISYWPLSKLLANVTLI